MAASRLIAYGDRPLPKLIRRASSGAPYGTTLPGLGCVVPGAYGLQAAVSICSTVAFGSTGIPGPMVVEIVTFLM